MSFQPPNIYANLSNGRSPVNSSSSSRISNGSSYEMIPPGSGSRTPADISFMNFPVGAPLSFSEISAEQALERVQELMKENQSLRGIHLHKIPNHCRKTVLSQNQISIKNSPYMHLCLSTFNQSLLQIESPNCL